MLLKLIVVVYGFNIFSFEVSVKTWDIQLKIVRLDCRLEYLVGWKTYDGCKKQVMYEAK